MARERDALNAEDIRLAEDAQRKKNWKRWGPYLAERQWGTVREDYSPGGDSWAYFSHDQARSRAYRWGEDGLLGISDRECRLCFALALWNGRDPILKERIFGLTGPEGNHGEDVKEHYFYLDSTPTHSYLKGLYKYPQAEFPYARLLEENRRRGKHEAEFEIDDTGVFEGGRYFDVFAEYAKASPDDILIRITVHNRGPETASVHLLPTLWFRNTWSWGNTEEGCEGRPEIRRDGPARLEARHATLGRFHFSASPGPRGEAPGLLLTENETNHRRLFAAPDGPLLAKDAFHDFVIRGEPREAATAMAGTKAAAHYRLEIPAGGSAAVRLRLVSEGESTGEPFGDGFEAIFARRVTEADAFHSARTPAGLDREEQRVVRQASAGLLWSKQFYHYSIGDWLQGDPRQPAPPGERLAGRNCEWRHFYSRDVLSMPDKWEYPWFAAWDLAFHMIPFARLDPQFAKEQLVLLLREWYMHPSGQIPAYEWSFSDVNPPVHAWAAWRIYKMTAPRGKRDRVFLARVFNKLLLNFTWWVNRKDVEGKHLFSGGFLGLDNIGVFDRSRPLPTGGHLEQADGTAWMAFYCTTMLAMALELAQEDPAYEDLASKFFEHFVAIADAMNNLGGAGLWDEADGFYYDQLHTSDSMIPMRIRSMVGLIPLFAVENLEEEDIDRLPGFKKRLEWFLEHRRELAQQVSYRETPVDDGTRHAHRLLAIPSKARLARVLRYLLDEREFLSPFGVRSLSAAHRDRPFVFRAGGEEHRVDYVPAESSSGLFGGNSNWRGPVWFPVNFLLVEALERYHHFYGDDFRVECPTGSGRWMNLEEVAGEISTRLSRIFLPGEGGARPLWGGKAGAGTDPHWRDLVLFHEYFHGDTGRGVGASHQTGWTALVAPLLASLGRKRERGGAAAAGRRLVAAEREVRS
jgi:mannosylglycerate hydrolase MGH1-like protein/glycosyl hydrolase family 63